MIQDPLYSEPGTTYLVSLLQKQKAYYHLSGNVLSFRMAPILIAANRRTTFLTPPNTYIIICLVRGIFQPPTATTQRDEPCLLDFVFHVHVHTCVHSLKGIQYHPLKKSGAPLRYRPIP